jgi:hypothetical protein
MLFPASVGRRGACARLRRLRQTRRLRPVPLSYITTSFPHHGGPGAPPLATRRHQLSDGAGGRPAPLPRNGGCSTLVRRDRRDVPLRLLSPGACRRARATVDQHCAGHASGGHVAPRAEAMPMPSMRALANRPDARRRGAPLLRVRALDSVRRERLFPLPEPHPPPQREKDSASGMIRLRRMRQTRRLRPVPVH